MPPRCVRRCSVFGAAKLSREDRTHIASIRICMGFGFAVRLEMHEKSLCPANTKPQALGITLGDTVILSFPRLAARVREESFTTN